jgi:hypothetical protein
MDNYQYVIAILPERQVLVTSVQHVPRPCPLRTRHQHEHQPQPSQHRPISISVDTTNQKISSHQRNRGSKESWPLTTPRRLRQLPSVLPDNLANGRDSERRMARPRLQHPQLRHIMYIALHTLLTTDFVNSYLSHYVCSPAFPRLIRRSRMSINRPSRQAHMKANSSSTISISKRAYFPLRPETLKLPKCVANPLL